MVDKRRQQGIDHPRLPRRRSLPTGQCDEGKFCKTPLTDNLFHQVMPVDQNGIGHASSLRAFNRSVQLLSMTTASR